MTRRLPLLCVVALLPGCIYSLDTSKEPFSCHGHQDCPENFWCNGVVTTGEPCDRPGAVGIDDGDTYYEGSAGDQSAIPFLCIEGLRRYTYCVDKEKAICDERICDKRICGAIAGAPNPEPTRCVPDVPQPEGCEPGMCPGGHICIDLIRFTDDHASGERHCIPEGEISP